MSSRLERLRSWRPGSGWIALVAVGLIGSDLGRRVLANNDEARFPLLAQDILARGDWLWPRLNGVVYRNKPPLLAWLIALASWPGGRVTQLTAVLPSAVAAVACVLLVYAIARDLFGVRAGRVAALVAMTTQGLFFHAHLALPDVLMTCFMTASLWMLVRMGQGRPGPWWIGFYGFAGLAFWAKGPAGLLPLAVGLVHGVMTRSRRTWSLRLAPGLPLVLGIIAPWWLLGALADRRAMTDVVMVDNLAWYLPRSTGLAAVIAPLRNALVALAPWVLLAPPAIWAAVASGRRRDDRDWLRLLEIWIGVLAVLIGLSHQQRGRYYVPLVAPVSILIGWWLADAMARHEGRLIRRAFVVTWALCAVVFVAGYHQEMKRHNVARDAAGLAARIRPRLEERQVVATWGAPELPLAFYLERPVVRLRSEPQVRAVLAQEPRPVVVVSPANWASLDDEERVTAVVDVAGRRGARR